MGWTVYNSSGQILQGSSTLADESVDSDHYVNASIDNAHLADNAVDTEEIAADAVTTAKILNDNVTNAKLANMVTRTIKGNATSGTADPTDIAMADGDFLIANGSALVTLPITGDVVINNAGVAAIQANVVDLAAMEHGGNGDIFYYNASGVPTRLNKPGTPAGEVLTFATSATIPSWAAAAGGGSLTFIDTSIASNDATVGVASLSATYDAFLIVGSDIVPTSNDVDLFLRFGDSSGIDTDNADYEWGMHTLYSGDTSYRAKSSASSSYIQVGGDDNIGGMGNQAGEGGSFVLWIATPSDATTRQIISGSSTYTNGAGGSVASFVWGARKVVMAVTSVEIHFASGNVSTGRLSLWGLKNS